VDGDMGVVCEKGLFGGLGRKKLGERPHMVVTDMGTLFQGPRQIGNLKGESEWCCSSLACA